MTPRRPVPSTRSTGVHTAVDASDAHGTRLFHPESTSPGTYCPLTKHFQRWGSALG